MPKPQKDNMGKEDFIKVENITKSFGKNKVLNNVSLSIPAHGITGILGLSGCGKTTLLNILVGFWKPDSGNVFYNSIDIKKNKRVMNQLFGFATQAGSVYSKLTVQENMEYFGRLYNMKGSDLKKRIPELLNLIELEDAKNVPVDELSTGMFRRLDIACSMIHKPKVLILDEPTSNMDPVLRKKIMALIKKIDDEGTKIIITSHLMDEVEKICHHLFIIHHGQIIAAGSSEELKDNYTDSREIKLQTVKEKYEKMMPELKKLSPKKVFIRESYVYLYTKEPEAALSSIQDIVKTNSDKIETIEIKRPSIEEVFEALTRK